MKTTIAPDFLEKREHFIPYRFGVLLDRLTSGAMFSTDEQESLRRLAEMIQLRFHFDFHADLTALRDAFTLFDPDRDTLFEPEYTKDELNLKAEELLRRVARLLGDCNFVRLSEERLNKALSLQPLGGLSVKVDTDEFSLFHVYYRGVRKGTRAFPKWQFWRRNQTREATLLKKVFVLARGQKESGGQIILKMFKNVPVENLKIVAPKITLSLPIFDRLKIGGTVLGGLAMTGYKLAVAAALSTWLFVIVLCGFILALLKGVFGFLNSRTKYMQRCSSSLYYQNLSNNASAITSLVIMAEEQEIKETLLAYAVLAAKRDGAMTESALDTAVERWLFDEFGYDVDFEVHDGLRKMREKNILIEEPASKESAPSETKNLGQEEKRYRAAPFPDALRAMDADWDHLFTA